MYVLRIIFSLFLIDTLLNNQDSQLTGSSLNEFAILIEFIFANIYTSSKLISTLKS